MKPTDSSREWRTEKDILALAGGQWGATKEIVYPTKAHHLYHGKDKGE